MRKSDQRWTAQELADRIARRHPLAKGWYTVTEFCPASGNQYKAGRMDVLVVCLYSRSGFSVHFARGEESKKRRSPTGRGGHAPAVAGHDSGSGRTRPERGNPKGGTG